MQAAVLATQGVFYVLTGLWAILSIGTFQRVTGPKVDRWLVKTVGALVTVIGVVLLTAAARNRPSTEVHMLAAGSAVALAIVDVVYSLNGRISKVYLLDAVAETALVAALSGTRVLDSRERKALEFDSMHV